ncbi:MAG: Dihydroorotase [Candidatus Moanabacter tarae]|uniref:Dihydroorotase n=1 Tax=Candidatus Moanibacter tarae TaxID=2200854 RepID=A0A2Z4ABM4_9BACT|nr:MAG: Dihydroorotase [Candidatus Moanabacter tarae]|tara:strand:- start:7411 stop:8721 length:1311 start_codon:yes stop_codon:yes gene_type:complete
MSGSLRITRGRVIDPYNDRDEEGDIYVLNGQIVNKLTRSEEKAVETIDATGLVVCPGLVDIHVHLREPGETYKETIASGTRAAAAGGFTTIVCMPNTAPPADNAGTIQYINDTVRRDAVVNVLPTGCITVGMRGETLAPIGSLKRAGVIAITDDGFCVQNNEIMRRALEYAHMFDLPLLDHCQDYNLTEGAVINEGEWSLRLGLRGWPNAAEDIIVSRNIILSSYSGAHIHLQHITSAYAIDVIKSAKQRGIQITAEATPHHISLNDGDLDTYNTNFKMNPPLRTKQDQEALIRALIEGTIDCIGTDHAPHTDYEKDKEFDYAPNGIVGLETALSVSFRSLVEEGHCDLPFLISLFTYKPSRILSIERGTLSPGSAADITLFNPKEDWICKPETLQSISKNSPWLGQILPGRIKCTIVGGNVVWDGEKILPTSDLA